MLLILIQDVMSFMRCILLCNGPATFSMIDGVSTGWIVNKLLSIYVLVHR